MNIAIYLRISREDENLTESDSISNQRQYLHNFIKSNDFTYENIFEYIDDGKSGTNLKRKGITNILDDVKKGKINCIIVKDLSRFGRNYIETTEYIENIFPLLNVRFIAVNDNFDSANDDFNSYFNLNFKNIIYSYYSKDISKKIKTAQISKAKTGKIPTSSNPYGYVVSKTDKYKFDIDTNTYKIVQDIFNMACEDKNLTQIAKILNDKNIPTPLEYKMSMGKVNKLGKCKGKMFWKSLTVRNILKNDVYIGKRTYGKTEIKEVGSKNYKNIDKNNWVVFENHHPAIISEDLFYDAQKVFKNNKTRTIKENLFKGILKCGYCGYDLQKINNSSIKYTCNTVRYTNQYGCKYFMIEEEYLKKVVLNEIHKNFEIKKNKNDTHKNNIDEQLKIIKLQKEKLYTSYLKEEICKKMYIEEKQKLNIKEDKILEHTSKENINCFDNKGELTREFLEKYVKSVVVFQENVKVNTI
ncbi:recombinase family protein [uncultured Tyzzerella sp.]|uniref:recombinase family protein n=1 Tax=uncultured Tyzzerella sp. TaxID=2321398 RepID=UPI0029434B41|nr:recombinase family protein [uncultured Tyzzerella sp.]